MKHLKKLENDSTAVFTQTLNETLDAIQEVRAGNHQATFFQRLLDRAKQVRDRANQLAMENRYFLACQCAVVPIRH